MEFNQAELDLFRDAHKGHSNKKRESRVWGTLRIWDKFAFFLYVIAFLLLLTSIFLFVLPTLLLLISELGMAALVPPVVLLFPKITLFQIATGTFIASVLLMLLARGRVMHNHTLRPECGCPICQERELIRVPRKRRDRMFGFVGVTAWRYSCRNCMWGGLRVGGQRPLPAKKRKQKAPVVVASAVETESDPVEMPLAMVAEVEVPREAILDEVEPVDELLIDNFEETAVEAIPNPDPQEVHSPDSELLPAALDDENIFDSEFERLCYEAAQTK